jgi:hypothetical protein
MIDTSRSITGDRTNRQFKNDVVAWTVVGLIFCGVNLALWAPEIWHAIH